MTDKNELISIQYIGGLIKLAIDLLHSTTLTLLVYFNIIESPYLIVRAKLQLKYGQAMYVGYRTLLFVTSR